MKVVLDENLPHELRHELPGHDVFTVHYCGWSGTKNGKLLALAAQENFDVFLTMDSGVQYQQNLASLPLAIVILSAPSNDIDDLRPLIPTPLNALGQVRPCSVVRVP